MLFTKNLNKIKVRGEGGGRGLELVNFFFKESKSKKNFLRAGRGGGGRGGGGEGARASDSFLL